MTVSSIVPVNNYSGNSSTTQFDFDFLIEAEEELAVQHTDGDGVITTLTLGLDYSINEIGNEEGSYITFPLSSSSYDVLGEDETISLMLTLTIKQESEFKNSSYFNFTVLEWTFDYIVRILQILSRQIERCIKISEGSSNTADSILEEFNNILSTCVNTAESVSENKEQIAEYVENIEQQISDFNTAYEDCYQNILNSDINTKLNKRQITNCILEIAKNVDLELEDGELTLKAGSTVIYPNGLDDDGNKVFEYYTPDEDITFTATSTYTGTCYRSFNSAKSGITGNTVSCWYSGSEEPSISSSDAFWYDTTNNLIKYTSDGGSTWTGSSSFPFCQIYLDSGVQTNIDYIFNGWGLIGSTMWLDKDVTMLIPNGRNDDGSLNNIEYTTEDLYIQTTTSSSTSVLNEMNFFRLDSLELVRIQSEYIAYSSLPPEDETITAWYNIDKNKWYYRSSTTSSAWIEKQYCPISTMQINAGRFYILGSSSNTNLTTRFDLENFVQNNNNPQYKSRVSISSGYTCSANGYINLYTLVLPSGNSNFYLYINSTLAGYWNWVNSDSANRTGGYTYRVSYGDVITWSSSVSGSTAVSPSVYFVPMKGF